MTIPNFLMKSQARLYLIKCHSDIGNIDLIAQLPYGMLVVKEKVKGSNKLREEITWTLRELMDVRF